MYAPFDLRLAIISYWLSAISFQLKPPGLKPRPKVASFGTAEAVPFQSCRPFRDSITVSYHTHHLRGGLSASLSAPPALSHSSDPYSLESQRTGSRIANHKLPITNSYTLLHISARGSSGF